MAWVNTNNLKIDVGGSASGTTLFANGLHMTGVLISFTASYSGNSGPTCTEIKSQTYLQYSTDGGTKFFDMNWLKFAPGTLYPASGLSYTDDKDSMFYPTKNVKQGQCDGASKSLNSISELQLDYQVDDSKPICEVIPDAWETKGLPSFTDTSVTYHIVQGDRTHSDVIIRAKVGNGGAGAPNVAYSGNTIKISFRTDTKYYKEDYVVCDGDKFNSNVTSWFSSKRYIFKAKFEQHNHHITINQSKHPGYYIKYAMLWTGGELLSDVYKSGDYTYDSLSPGSPMFSWRTENNDHCTCIKNILILFPFSSNVSKFTIASDDLNGDAMVKLLSDVQFGGEPQCSLGGGSSVRFANTSFFDLGIDEGSGSAWFNVSANSYIKNHINIFDQYRNVGSLTIKRPDDSWSWNDDYIDNY